MTSTLSLDRPRPIQTGGGGTLMEVLLGLATGIAAILAALAWRRPPASEPSRDETETREEPASARAPDEERTSP